MTDGYDIPRPAMKIIVGDLVEIIERRTVRKFFKNIEERFVLGRGVITDIEFTDAGYSATVQMEYRKVKCDPSNLILVKKLENRVDDLEAEIQEFLQTQNS